MGHNYSRAEFIPRHPEKYLGVGSIVYRSSWELHMMNFLDTNPSIKYWSSESIVINYYHPIKKKIARYTPDFFIIYEDKDGKLHHEVIEIKPSAQASLKHAGKSIRNQAMVWINKSKWKAATEWCQSQGYEFRVIVEQQLFHNAKK